MGSSAIKLEAKGIQGVGYESWEGKRRKAC